MMKTSLALAAFPLLAGASELAPATVEIKGTSFLSLSAASTDTKSGGQSVTSDSLALGGDVGGLYYVLPNFGLGIHGGYDYSRFKANGITTTSDALSVGPLVSYQFPVAPRLAIFQRAQGSWIHGSSSTSGGSPGLATTFDGRLTTRGYGFGLQAGVKYFPVKAVSLEAGLGWSLTHVENDGFPGKVTSDSSRFGLDVGLSIYFGGASHEPAQ